MTQPPDSPTEKYRGLWKRQTKSGTDKFVGLAVVEGREYWLSVYPNTYKNADKHPDYTFSLTLKTY